MNTNDNSTSQSSPSLEELLSSYQKLTEAQNQYKDNLSNVQMLQGASTLANIPALLYGGKPTESDLTIPMQLAKRPLEEVAEQNTNLLNQFRIQQGSRDLEQQQILDTPESEISKLYQGQAEKVWKTLQLPEEQKPNFSNMSANQLENIFGKSMLVPKERTAQQTQYVEKDTNDPVTFDPNTNTYKNAVTGKIIQKSGVLVRPIAYTDPGTGEKTYLSASGPVRLTGPAAIKPSATQPSETKQEPRTPFEVKKQLVKTEKDVLNKAVDRFQNDVKDEKQTISELNSISDSTLGLARKNANAAKTLGAQIAKILQGSRLTDKDVLLYTGRAGVMNQLVDFASEAGTGTISEGKYKDIKQTLDAYTQALKRSLNDRAEDAASTVIQNFNPNLQLQTKEIKPIFFQENMESPKSDLVKIKLPDGRVGTVPKEKLQKALKMGAKEI
jgi:hypothetical protein